MEFFLQIIYKKLQSKHWILRRNIHKILVGRWKMTSFKPGEVAPQTGNYTAYDSEGHCGGSCFLEKGERFPATQHEGSYYEMEE